MGSAQLGTDVVQGSAQPFFQHGVIVGHREDVLDGHPALQRPREQMGEMLAPGCKNLRAKKSTGGRFRVNVQQSAKPGNLPFGATAHLLTS